MAQEWIAKAIKRPGALTAKAKAAGKSIGEFCAQQGHDLTTQKQCSLAQTLRGFKKN